MKEYIIFRCVVGSRAFGLDIESSDFDRRGIYLPPADLQWSLKGVPEQLEDDAEQECYWELEKFISLALKSNPNVLECLYSPLIELATPLAQELIAERARFLSKECFQTFDGYASSQFRKLEQDLRTRGEPKWKHVMHLLRLLISGTTIMRDGLVPVRVGEHRERLMAVRQGQIAWEEIDEWRQQLHREIAAAHAESKLPERPDFEWADAFLIKARRQMI